MKEIGGYLGLEQFSGREYHADLAAVNSGRNALLYILKARGVKKLDIPAFLCDSVRELCRREGVTFDEYGVGPDFLPRFDRTLAEGEWLYVVNYYGQLSNGYLAELKDRFGRLIVDNVQDFFRRPLSGVDTVYSCRKFFGVPDGGYAACDAALPLEQDGSRDRMRHILGRYEVSGSAFYAAFQENDELFYDLPLRAMSPITRNLLRAVDYDEVKRRRNANYAILAAALDERNPLALTVPDGPYCYPFYCEDGMAVKRALAQEKIYVPTLWPTLAQNASETEKDYAENILPLPVDQRYGEEEMKQIVRRLENVRKFTR